MKCILFIFAGRSLEKFSGVYLADHSVVNTNIVDSINPSAEALQ